MEGKQSESTEGKGVTVEERFRNKGGYPPSRNGVNGSLEQLGICKFKVRRNVVTLLVTRKLPSAEETARLARTLDDLP